MLGALEVRVVLLYRVQGDVADAARVAALQACQENPESLIVPCPQHRPCVQCGLGASSEMHWEEKDLRAWTTDYSESEWQLESTTE